MFRGRDYWLSYDPSGRRQVQVRVGSVVHTLVDESIPRSGTTAVEQSDFRALVSFSHEIRGAANR